MWRAEEMILAVDEMSQAGEWLGRKPERLLMHAWLLSVLGKGTGNFG